jgi:hypothetical protein
MMLPLIQSATGDTAILKKVLRPCPRWFKIAFRVLANAVLVGLTGSVLHHRCGVPMPGLLIAALAFIAVNGGMAFVLLEWFGAWRGYVRSRDAAIYTAAFIVMGCVSMLAVP